MKYPVKCGDGLAQNISCFRRSKKFLGPDFATHSTERVPRKILQVPHEACPVHFSPSDKIQKSRRKPAFLYFVAGEGLAKNKFRFRRIEIFLGPDSVTRLARRVPRGILQVPT